MTKRIAYTITDAGQVSRCFGRSPQEAAKAYAVKLYGRNAQAWRSGPIRNREVFIIMLEQNIVAAVEVRPTPTA